jgi:RNA polymerase sigma-70 factor (ECF subfamily)
MVQKEPEQRLSQISTLWTVVADAKGGPAEAISAAQHELLRRYHGAIYRYLLGALRNADAADDLAQEFALRFLRGDFRGFNPERGRFRDFLKGVLSHLIADYHRRQYTRAQSLSVNGAALAASSEGIRRSDWHFAESWRDELLSRTWEALARSQEETGQPFYAVMRLRTQHPEMRSAAMAEQLSVQLSRRVTGNWVRQMLYRGRDRFADLLLGEVADTLQDPRAEELEEELAEIGLLSYCQSALERYRGKN